MFGYHNNLLLKVKVLSMTRGGKGHCATLTWPLFAVFATASSLLKQKEPSNNPRLLPRIASYRIYEYLYNRCAYSQPTNHMPNPRPQPHVRKVLIYSQMMLVNKNLVLSALKAALCIGFVIVILFCRNRISHHIDCVFPECLLQRDHVLGILLLVFIVHCKSTVESLRE